MEFLKKSEKKIERIVRLLMTEKHTVRTKIKKEKFWLTNPLF